MKQIVARADVIIQSFRPGVMERYGLDYDSVAKLNERIVYGSTSGYGDTGPWRDRPGQDLLIQALSGLTWLNGNRDDPPVAFGLSIVDTLAGAHLCQGILACLVRRGSDRARRLRRGQPARVGARPPVRGADLPT